MGENTMSKIPGMTIKGLKIPYCIIQGGMGARVSGPRLTRAVHQNGGLGVLSSAGLKCLRSIIDDKKHSTYTAIRAEIEEAMIGNFNVGINVMRVLEESYDETIRAAMDAKVSAIFLGAGVPKKIVTTDDTALVLIVSSARALRIILHYWKQQPDAIVLEGPMAGGHLGFKMEDVGKPESSLEKLLPPVLDIAKDIPVIVAGGIYTHEDILKFLAMGAKGVQMGTRFLATKESEAIREFKEAIVASTEKDILVVGSSPCGFPFRILKESPAYQELLQGTRRSKCRMGYVLEKDGDGQYTICKAHPNNPERNKYFCICDALRAAVGLVSDEPPMYTVGSNAYRVNKIISVAELMKELIGD
jgi:nitronate monooxygenase